MKRYILLFLAFTLLGCNNLKSYENAVVGDYAVDNFIGNSASFSKDQCRLSINDDHTFVFINKGKEIEGEWQAESGPLNSTVVKFIATDFDTNGLVFDPGQINIVKANLYIDESLKDITFKKD